MSLPSRTAPLAHRLFSSRLPLCATRPFAPQNLRQYSTALSEGKLKRALDRSMSRAGHKKHLDPTISSSEKSSHTEYFKDGGGPLFPGTFISLPLSEAPRSPARFVKYQWIRLRVWGTGFLTGLSFKLRSMPNWTTRPKWKLHRGKIAPTAKALYQEVLEAFAAGDRKAVAKLCSPQFSNRLRAAIENRSSQERVRFEVLKYNQPLLYPTLKSHQIHQINTSAKHMFMEQAVVAVASTQQVSRYNTLTGETLPGSARIQDKLEYVVMTRHIDSRTFEVPGWRVWGTIKPTTLEKHETDVALMAKEQASRAGWKA